MLETVFAHSFSTGEWHGPFLYPGKSSRSPELDGLSFDQRWQLSQIVECRFNELAAANGSSAVWKQVQTIVWGKGLLLPEGEVSRADETTNLQLVEWRDQAISEVLGWIQFREDLIGIVEKVL